MHVTLGDHNRLTWCAAAASGPDRATKLVAVAKTADMLIVRSSRNPVGANIAPRLCQSIPFVSSRFNGSSYFRCKTTNSAISGTVCANAVASADPRTPRCNGLKMKAGSRAMLSRLHASVA